MELRRLEFGWLELSWLEQRLLGSLILIPGKLVAHKKFYVHGEHVMNSQTLINSLEITLLIAVIAALVLALWMSVPFHTVLATVSWNG